VAAVVLLRNREQPYDRSFDSRVTNPAYRGNGPVVLYDEGHNNAHTTGTGYKPLADLVRNDGYTLGVSQQPITRETLNGVNVLVVAVARGANDTNDSSAFSEAEAAVIEEWVSGAGALLLVTDHWPFGSADAPLARHLGVSMGAGFVEDSIHYDKQRGLSHIVFSADNGLLRDHPIVRGRNATERVRRVLTFTGQSVRGPADAVSFLTLSNSGTERPPGPAKAERVGGDTRVSMEYCDPVSAVGGSQGLAVEMQSGRIVVLGEAGMLRAQRDRNAGLVGMNAPGYDNKQLALNIMH
jgi:hypothetical protein